MAAPKRKRAPSLRRVAESPADVSRLLLDTHAWLWWQRNDARLGPTTRAAIATARDVRFSVASAWEISIKTALGKLTLPRGADIEEELRRDGFAPLNIEIAHTRALSTLPALHRDPFDRMLVAQATVEGLTLVTADDALRGYGVRTLLATE